MRPYITMAIPTVPSATHMFWSATAHMKKKILQGLELQGQDCEASRGLIRSTQGGDIPPASRKPFDMLLCGGYLHDPLRGTYSLLQASDTRKTHFIVVDL